LIRDCLKKSQRPFREFDLEENKGLSEKIDQCSDFREFTELVAVEMGFQVGGEEILFIDEAQESRRLGSFVRFMKEKWACTQVILSGSSMSRIFRDDVRYPVGRVTSLNLQSFSFTEFLAASAQKALLELVHSFPQEQQISPNSHQRLLGLLDEYLEVGGLPEVVTTYFQDGDWKRVREDILLGYYNDFKRVYGEERQAYFIAGLKATAQLLGLPFKNSHVATLMDGGKQAEIIKSLSQLEAWRIIFKVDQRGPAVQTQLHPKRYLFDTGLAKHLREVGIPSINLLSTLDSQHRTPLGGLIENVVMHSLANKLEVTGWKKSSSGSEIDFVIKQGKQLIPIECKAALKIKNSHLGGVRDFMKIYDVPQAVLASLAPFERRKLPEGRHVIILPLYLIEYCEAVL
jgi:predicted AAA+ superfamily ATPase